MGVASKHSTFGLKAKVLVLAWNLKTEEMGSLRMAIECFRRMIRADHSGEIVRRYLKC